MMLLFNNVSFIITEILTYYTFHQKEKATKIVPNIVGEHKGNFKIRNFLKKIVGTLLMRVPTR
ncbi:hypothetical protein AB685_03970 [Bacillus sp. LL01]|nr:hypothetical protein AB685_03970 [Bacillus sp. LL01]